MPLLQAGAVAAEEERLRERVRALDDATRQRFWAAATPKLRDPDTYAVLNWAFFVGLHHFYLGRWPRGLATLALFLLGIALVFVPGARFAGALLVGAIVVVECYELFRSQLLVQHHNNRILALELERLKLPR